MEVSVVVNDLEGEGILAVTEDVNVSTMTEMGYDSGCTRCKFSRNIVIKYGCDAWGVSGIGGDGCKETEGNETGSQAETDKYQDEMQSPMAVNSLHHFQTPEHLLLHLFFIASVSDMKNDILGSRQQFKCLVSLWEMLSCC